MLSVAGGEGLSEGAWGLKILTSKKALSERPPQTPFAAMSSLAPSSEIAVAFESTSPVIGCRVGSTHTS